MRLRPALLTLLVCALPAAPATAASPPAVLDLATDALVERPTQWALGGVAGSWRFAGLSWSRWDATGASGAGTSPLRLCGPPDCASNSTYYEYPVELALSVPVTSCQGFRPVFSALQVRTLFPPGNPFDQPAGWVTENRDLAVPAVLAKFANVQGGSALEAVCWTAPPEGFGNGLLQVRLGNGKVLRRTVKDVMTEDSGITGFRQRNKQRGKEILLVMQHNSTCNTVQTYTVTSKSIKKIAERC